MEELTDKVEELEIGLNAHYNVALVSYNRILSVLQKPDKVDKTLGDRVTRKGRNKIRKLEVELEKERNKNKIAIQPIEEKVEFDKESQPIIVGKSDELTKEIINSDFKEPQEIP